MPELENRMVVDSEWDGIEYGVPDKERLQRMRQAYEAKERMDRENEYTVRDYRGLPSLAGNA